MKRITSQFKILPGYDPNVMYILKDQLHNLIDTIRGHLMMDKIKLKNGIMWNCMNNEITGFLEEDLNTNESLEYILGIAKKKEDDGKQLSVYANQWRFRST